MSVRNSPRIFLASAWRSGDTDFGMAQPQISFHAIGVLRPGPTGNRAKAILPATRDLFLSLNSPQKVESAAVIAASPAMKIALASFRPYAVIASGAILSLCNASHQYSTTCW